MRLLRLLALLPALGLGCGIELLDPEAPGHLVPATAAEDPLLPQLRVEVAGVERALHLRRFGDPEDPVILALPGGPGLDFRLLLPLEALADHHHVVMWDPRGAGLSERVAARELTLDGFTEEIRAVHSAVAPGRPAVLIGHSFGALLMMRYAAAHPEAVEKLILIEPGGITGAARSAYRGGAVGFGDGQSFFWQNELLTSTDHASADYKAVDLLPLASRNFTCSGAPPEPYPMWRFGAYHYHTVMTRLRGCGRGFDWAEGLAEGAPPIVVVAGSCGAAGAEFQQTYNLEALPGAHLEVIPGANHVSLFVQHAESTLDRLRAHLGAGAGTGDEGSPP
jgi:proline iminopeptidase